MLRRALIVLSLVLVALAVYTGSLIVSYDRIFRPPSPDRFADVARIESAIVHRVVRPRKVEQLVALLAEARGKGLKVSISGSRHSQGGHILYDNALALDMRDFDEVLAFDRERKIIRVEAGATWDDVQRYVAPHGLAIKVMQSSNIFTVGGTLSANAHGRDLDKTSVVDTVRSIHVLTADGQVVEASREKNPELLRLVIGGYGMFGVIVDAELDLVDDEVYEQRATIVDYRDFSTHFEKAVKADPTVALMLSRPSIAPHDFLRNIVVTTWHRTDERPAGVFALSEEEHVWRDKLFFGLSRKWDWAKRLRWALQQRVELGVGETRVMSRNNAMRPPLAPLEFLDYYSTNDTDVIQEYFVPVRSFVSFMDDMRRILTEGAMNVLSATIRFVRRNDEVALPYSPREDAFAIIYMCNVRLSAEAQVHARAVTRRLVDAAIAAGGTYYLTYQLYPTRDQLLAAYPGAQEVFARKRAYDPQELFMNRFYAAYAHPTAR